MIRRTADVPIIPGGLIPFKSWFKFAYTKRFWTCKKTYRLIMVTPKFHSFISSFSTSSWLFFCKCTLLKSSVYRNAQNNICLYKFLVQVTSFRFMHELCLRVSKLLPHRFRKFTNGFSLLFSQIFLHFPNK